MAVNDRTLHLAERMRAELNAHVDKATNDLVAAWVYAWDDLAMVWETAIADLVAHQAAHDGAWPPAWRIAQAERVQRALDATRAALDGLAQQTNTRVIETLPVLTADAAEWQARLIASQMPPTAVAGSGALSVTFNRVDVGALRAIVERTTEQVTALTRPLSSEATAAMSRHLVRGIALGDNPATAAQRMLNEVESGFNGGLPRALTIARTEMLDAYRESARDQRKANADVLAGWQWQATLDRRTCPSCLAKHGQTHPADSPGPTDHQNGRCAALPVTKSWRELGFDVEDSPSTLPDARAWFDSLPDADQLKVMGAERLDLLRSGSVTWDDLSTRKSTPGWRDSHHVTSVRDLRLLARTAPERGALASVAPAVPRAGIITVPEAPGFKLEVHEFATAQRLAAAGHNVEFLVPSRERGVKNPDILIDGVVWEMKSPLGAGANTVDHQMKRAAKQADRLVLDTARSTLDDAAIIATVTRRLATYDGLSHVIVVDKSGTLVYLDGTR
ncbi:phage minor head protein [Oerskovia paurometabola]|uniref:CdiA C-terminal domain-containing protein n=1 Tax=Oerskovia paurometabola TaxID=162170 RepID=UPI0034269B89